MEPNQIVKEIYKAIEDKKAKNIVILKVSDLTVLADYFVICEGTSSTQVRAIAQEADVKLKELSNPPLRTEGHGSSSWIVVDFGSVILHVFDSEAREFYHLERLWADGEQTDISSL